MGELIAIGNTSRIGARRQMDHTRFIHVAAGSKQLILADTIGHCIFCGKRRRLPMVKLQKYRGDLFHEQILGLGSCIEIEKNTTIWAVATTWSDNFCTPTGLVLMVIGAQESRDT